MGDVITENVDIGQAALSQQDIEMRERQDVYKRMLNKTGAEINKLLKRSEFLLSKTKTQTVHANYKFNGEVKFNELEAKNIMTTDKKINGIDLSYIALNALYIDQNNSIIGNKTFTGNVQMKENLKVDGLIDGIATSELVLLNSDQVIYGRKIFKGNLFFDGTRSQTKNLEIRGLINNINVSNEELLTVKDDQVVTGNYSFKEDLKMEKDLTVKSVNGIDLSDLYKDAVLVDTAQNITGLKQFKSSLTIEGDLEMADSTTIDGVDVSELAKSILSRTKDQTISASIDFKSNVTFHSDLTVDGFINGINITNDVVYLSREQIISGEKTFLQDLTATKNIEIDGLVNGLNISGIYLF